MLGRGGGGSGTRPWCGFGCLWRRLLASHPLHILTLCRSERVLVMSTEPLDDLSCLTTPGLGRPSRTASGGWGGGGVNYDTHPPQKLGKPRTGGGGGWTGNHRATQPATKAVHKTRALDQFSEISEILSHMSSL